jgi:hypothetical protein
MKKNLEDDDKRVLKRMRNFVYVQKKKSGRVDNEV